MNKIHARNVSYEHAGREHVHGRRTCGHMYGPGDCAWLHEGPCLD